MFISEGNMLHDAVYRKKHEMAKYLLEEVGLDITFLDHYCKFFYLKNNLKYLFSTLKLDISVVSKNGY